MMGPQVHTHEHDTMAPGVWPVLKLTAAALAVCARPTTVTRGVPVITRNFLQAHLIPSSCRGCVLT